MWCLSTKADVIELPFCQLTTRLMACVDMHRWPLYLRCMPCWFWRCYNQTRRYLVVSRSFDAGVIRLQVPNNYYKFSYAAIMVVMLKELIDIVWPPLLNAPSPSKITDRGVSIYQFWVKEMLFHKNQCCKVHSSQAAHNHHYLPTQKQKISGDTWISQLLTSISFQRDLYIILCRLPLCWAKLIDPKNWNTMPLQGIWVHT